nr:immunoglobulin heavy chain junction region [Macaca mulatta]MOY26592.1 immunoglobulin heavy chain junction region [Macaca mulatta]MOY27205.1 immunoglobulin heavy chain junction region [Macaca mulatta]
CATAAISQFDYW